ncbi:MAG: hypothetical protein EX285_03020 [Thaumarchaeota archaeon]|nr:hypothetical protein [Nitrososphaerota archaeon]
MEIQTFSSQDYLSQIEKWNERVSEIERWETIHRNGNYYEIEHGGWRLPGTGKSRVDCGLWKSYGCLNTKNHPGLNQAYVRTHMLTCFRASCPICHPNWIAREANRGTHKIEKYSEIKKLEPKHIVVSLGWSKRNLPFDEMKKLVRRTLKEVNVRAGCMMFHAFRHKKINDIQEWYWSPHFHIMGFGYVKNVEYVSKKTDCVIKNLGVRKSVHATLWYALDHCGIRKGSHSVTWFGGLSNRSIAMYNPECKPEKDEEWNKCPYCGIKLRLLEVTGTLDHPPPIWSIQKFEGLVEYSPFVVRYDPSENVPKYKTPKISMRNLSLDLGLMKLVPTPVKDIRKGIELWN